MPRIAVALGVAGVGVGVFVAVGVARDTVGGSHRGLVLAVQARCARVSGCSNGPRESRSTLTTSHPSTGYGRHTVGRTLSTRAVVVVPIRVTPTVLHTLAQRGGRAAGGAGEAGVVGGGGGHCNSSKTDGADCMSIGLSNNEI